MSVVAKEMNRIHGAFMFSDMYFINGKCWFRYMSFRISIC